MLSDEHFKVLHYEPDSSKVFCGAEIKGGVAIHYRDSQAILGPIDTFTSYPELNSISQKVKALFISDLGSIMYPYSTYTLANRLWEDFPNRKAEVEYIAKNRNKLSKDEKEGKLSNLRIITTNIFYLLCLIGMRIYFLMQNRTTSTNTAESWGVQMDNDAPSGFVRVTLISQRITTSIKF